MGSPVASDRPSKRAFASGSLTPARTVGGQPGEEAAKLTPERKLVIWQWLQ